MRKITFEVKATIIVETDCDDTDEIMDSIVMDADHESVFLEDFVIDAYKVADAK